MDYIQKHFIQKYKILFPSSPLAISICSFVLSIIAILTIPVTFSNSSLAIKGSYYFILTLFLATIIYSCSSLYFKFSSLLNNNSKTSNVNYLFDFIKYSSCCAVILAVYLLAFFPGIMSPDSLGQWRQIVEFSFTDWHPPFHTLSMWLLTRIWFTPAIICIFQIFSFSIVSAYGLITLKRIGVSKYIVATIFVLLSLSPLNGLYVITLWKDIPYSIVLLLITIILINILRTDGDYLSSKLNLIFLSALLSSVILLRHNGILAVLAVIVSLFISFKKYWKNISIMTAVTFLLMYLIQGPLYDAVKVKKGSFPNLYYLMANQISAVVDSHGYFKQSELDFLAKITPISTWESKYSKYSSSPLVFDTENVFNLPFINANKAQFINTWKNISIRNAPIVAKHQLAVSSLVWRISDPYDGYLYVTEGLDQNNIGIRENDQGLINKSQLPLINLYLTQMIKFISDYKYNWLFFRPAIYLLLSLYSIFLITVKTKDIKHLLIIYPLFFNSLGVLLTVPSQDVRYMYPAFIIAPIIFGYIFQPTKALDVSSKAVGKKPVVVL